jgi:hypothetical protein
MVVDGEGRGLVFNQQDAFYRGLVASNATLAQTLQGMLAKTLSERR